MAWALGVLTSVLGDSNEKAELRTTFFRSSHFSFSFNSLLYPYLSHNVFQNILISLTLFLIMKLYISHGLLYSFQQNDNITSLNSLYFLSQFCASSRDLSVHWRSGVHRVTYGPFFLLVGASLPFQRKQQPEDQEDKLVLRMST